jgi:hypothetical protein
MVFSLVQVLSILARHGRASVRQDAIVFKAPVLRLLFGGGIVGITLVIVRDGSQEEWWIVLCLVLFVFCCCLLWPSIITITDTGIEQRRWWQRTRSIPWSEVTAVLENSYGEILVLGRHDRIGFTPHHVDPQRFLDEVTSRGKIKKTIDPSAPLTIRS